MNKGLLNVDEALERLLAGARPVAETELVHTLDAAGRVLAAAQRSGRLAAAQTTAGATGGVAAN